VFYCKSVATFKVSIPAETGTLRHRFENSVTTNFKILMIRRYTGLNFLSKKLSIRFKSILKSNYLFISCPITERIQAEDE
jgi:hypothetical protein